MLDTTVLSGSDLCHKYGSSALCYSCQHCIDASVVSTPEKTLVVSFRCELCSLGQGDYIRPYVSCQDYLKREVA